MKKNRKSKKTVAIILSIAILGLSLGFAAFSNELRIESSADVNLENNLKVYFSSLENSQSTAVGENNIYLSETYLGFSAATPIIDNSVPGAPLLSNLKATFVRPGQSVRYSFFVHNASDYDIQLTSIEFGTKKCTAKTGTDQNLVNNACDEIDLSVEIGSDTNVVTRTQNTATSSTVTNHFLTAEEYEPIYIVLSYNELAGENTTVNGDFEVSFGDVKLTYSSAVSE